MTRSAKKGSNVLASVIKKVKRAKKAKTAAPIKIWERSSMINPSCVGLKFAVHNGKKFIDLHVTEDMVGHRFGEFALTRTFRLHSGQRKANV